MCRACYCIPVSFNSPSPSDSVCVRCQRRLGNRIAPCCSYIHTFIFPVKEKWYIKTVHKNVIVTRTARRASITVASTACPQKNLPTPCFIIMNVETEIYNNAVNNDTRVFSIVFVHESRLFRFYSCLFCVSVLPVLLLKMLAPKRGQFLRHPCMPRVSYYH